MIRMLIKNKLNQVQEQQWRIICNRMSQPSGMLMTAFSNLEKWDEYDRLVAEEKRLKKLLGEE